MAGLALVLVAVALKATVLQGGSSAPAATPTPAPSKATSAPAPVDAADARATEALNRLLPELVAYVEHERGLHFKTPVHPTILDDAAFRARSNDSPKLDAAAQAKVDEETKLGERLLKTVGLISPETNLKDEIQQFYGDEIVGQYNTSTGELLVRGKEITPSSRATLVHELTHAVDDQYFELYRPELRDKDLEEADAFDALVEGDAQRVEDAYIAAMSPQDKALVDAEQAAGPTPSITTQPLVYLLAYSYIEGPAFIHALLDAGGQAQLDAAFKNPPSTTAEIVNPRRYLLGLHGALMTVPRSEGQVVDSGMFGAAALFAVLRTGISDQDAAIAALTWEGDNSVSWTNGDRTCVRIDALFSSPMVTAYLADKMQAWARKQPDAHVQDLGMLVLTTCR